ncbi:NAD(P)/FAD-dependent oxidoreductase [Streptomyces sp. EN23]|uniref:flavin-containing monooxygenase n=1 Tax=Streptomyces sp. EN23 TaxID=212774 RepID=UPI000851E5F1|nr:NAD(P)/FAD-dependent oxidoreductase [Streptomyces sp. EN23]
MAGTSRSGASTPRPTEVDVLVIGAGISGIGVAHHLATLRPGQTFAVLESRAEIGGTWSLFRYPGVRSDSDMPTFGYGFRPWPHRTTIAEGRTILEYLRDTIDEADIGEHLHFGHRVTAADFDSATGHWTVTTEVAGSGATAVFVSRFLFLGTGYYDYESAHTPDFPGAEAFEGQVIHPQFWPEDLDYQGKRVVVIGSGATAITLVPSMAKYARHVTMLQRSPSYVLTIPADDAIGAALRTLLGPERAYRLVRRRNIALHRILFRLCRRLPKLMRRALIGHVRSRLPRHFDVDTHFSPRYNPWDQRLCMTPNGELFRTIASGQASVVTDHIARFTRDGILLESGQELAADLIVTATGLRTLPFGQVALSVDGAPVHLPDRVAFKAMMLSGVPNLAYAIGYSNISWTLKVDLVAEHLCRLLDHMDTHGYDVVEPVLDDSAGTERLPLLDLDAGYVQRGIDDFPSAGAAGPWTLAHAYEADVDRLRHGPVEDPALRFTTVPRPARVG